MKSTTILAIETTCDETAIAILKIDKNNKPKIISNIVSSQIKIHAPFGGVVPSLAKREHQKNLIPVLKKALAEARLLKETKNPALKLDIKTKIDKILVRDGILREVTTEFLAQYKKPKIDIIAIAYGPGLEPALWPGVNLARALSLAWDIDIEKINHIEAHILANWIDKNNPKKSDFPAIALTVSGGHSQIVLVRGVGQYKIIGETRDDAAGECFDKSARLLGLGYPGGPAISKEAGKYEIKKKKNDIIVLPRPMINSKDFDFSFSGLKTAVLYLVEKLKKQKKSIKKLTPKIAHEIEEAITDVLVSKTISATKKYKAKTVILAGGVSANRRLREKMAEAVSQIPKTKFSAPEIKYSTDNGAMIAIAGYFHLKTKKRKMSSWKNLRAKGNLRI